MPTSRAQRRKNRATKKQHVAEQQEKANLAAAILESMLLQQQPEEEKSTGETNTTVPDSPDWPKPEPLAPVLPLEGKNNVYTLDGFREVWVPGENPCEYKRQKITAFEEISGRVQKRPSLRIFGAKRERPGGRDPMVCHQSEPDKASAKFTYIGLINERGRIHKLSAKRARDSQHSAIYQDIGFGQRVSNA
jgi:hypothetical protein